MYCSLACSQVQQSKIVPDEYSDRQLPHGQVHIFKRYEKPTVKEKLFCEVWWEQREILQEPTMMKKFASLLPKAQRLY